MRCMPSTQSITSILKSESGSFMWCGFSQKPAQGDIVCLSVVSFVHWDLRHVLDSVKAGLAELLFSGGKLEAAVSVLHSQSSFAQVREQRGTAHCGIGAGRTFDLKGIQRAAVIVNASGAATQQPVTDVRVLVASVTGPVPGGSID